MAKSRVTKLRERRRAHVDAIKEKEGCAVCGEKRHYVLVFHHVSGGGGRENSIGALIRETVNMDRLEAELSKCVVLCANCHRELHYLEKEELKQKYPFIKYVFYYSNTSKSRVSKFKAKRREFVNAIKTKEGCAICGDKRHYVLVFHHTTKGKEDSIGKLITESASMERLMAEISKCAVLCANCHRDFHYLEKQVLAEALE